MGHYPVRSGHTVYINDSTIFAHPGEDPNIAQDELHPRESQVQLRVFSVQADPLLQVVNSVASDGLIDVSITGYVAHFGADLSSSPTPHHENGFVQPIDRKSVV